MKFLMKFLFLIAFACFAFSFACAQAPTTFYAGGISYNPGGSPSLAGTGVFDHTLNGSGLSAFTAVDALPSSVKPFTVTTNFGVGVAQKVATVAGFDIFMPTAAGISFTGTNTGWQWSGGALASKRVKGNYYVMPNIRFLKASVGGDGYRPIFGVLVGFGR